MKEENIEPSKESVGETRGSSWMSKLWKVAPTNGPQLNRKSNDKGVCPVDHSKIPKPTNLMCPVDHPKILESSDSKCPVDPETQKIWLMKNYSGKKQATTTTTAAEAIECSSSEIPEKPIYKTNVKLPDEREISSIPRTGAEANWVYPSEKQFYEAMKRKKWDPSVDDMKTVVPIHNSVNERVWNFIKNWEKDQGGDDCGGVKLTSFNGNSKKLTPRAWMRSSIIGYSKPFDRHDWTINRCGKEIDYVIDFYSNDNEESKVPDIFLDVRPKLNSYEGFRLRLIKFIGF